MAQLALQHVAGNTYIIPSPATMGVYVTDQRAVLIDSGNDEDAGRQVLKLLSAQGWELELIVCTHSNADHIGGNAFLQKKTGCRIAATAQEAAFIEQPLQEPSLLYGGFPMKAIRNKFLMAKPSKVTDVIAPEGPILETGLEAMALPGHFVGMIGIRTPDNVLFLADSLFSPTIIAKYPIFFLYDVAGHLQTLARLGEVSAAHFVPSHAQLGTDLKELIDVNAQRVQATVQLVKDCCCEGASFEGVLEKVCTACGIVLDASQYVLVGSTVRSILSYLVDEGSVEMRFSGGRLTWVAT